MHDRTKRTILITAGPTQEKLDPVRYISNYSSGKMGFALAEAALSLGYQVILVSGPVSIPPPKKAKVIHVTSAREMYDAVMTQYKKADILMMVAAVADYRPVKSSKTKIKKKKETLTLKLVKNPDILKTLGAKRRKDQVLVGFAAETNHHEKHALKKLKEKKCDYIVMNNVARSDIGFQSDSNEVIVFGKNNISYNLRRASKLMIAKMILKIVI